ncbi:IpaD/SipD/SspD family type III secretion system needle tip protein [Serratia silvae]|uniref:IpaD/SipD/SspD family type III secretion system needle tip protein n=1 Tax=Serratia silvae TaxID=2824122 RepID=A0ABT0K9Q5_9GAMM|nr:IpaD/SipD/SspD family type III secretion system needle tip protein [Serratia silvae]MCL1028785.1 IpaD/SipD/SspD family type III secretion system needle tip protein [Serratia silvae]
MATVSATLHQFVLPTVIDINPSECETSSNTLADTPPSATASHAIRNNTPASHGYRTANEGYSQRLDAYCHQPTLGANDLTKAATLIGVLHHSQQLEARHLINEWNTTLLENMDEAQLSGVIEQRAGRSTARSSAIPPAIPRGADKYPLSSWELGDKLADSIKDMNEEYLKTFQEGVAKYNEFFADFSKDIVNIIANNVKVDEDGDIQFEGGNVYKALNKLLKKYDVSKPTKSATLFPKQSGNGSDRVTSGGSKAEAEAWANQFGLPAHCVKKLSNGQYVVTMDTSAVQNIKDKLPVRYPEAPTSSYVKFMSTVEWSAWQSSFDQQKGNLQTGLQTVVQKYAGANSTYENLVKILSGTISSLLESDKSFFNI